jgi:hypothetical protein
VVGRAFPFGLDQNREFRKILPVPSRKRLEELETLARWRNIDRELVAVFSRRDEAFFSFGKPFGRKLFTARGLEMNLCPIGRL